MNFSDALKAVAAAVFMAGGLPGASAQTTLNFDRQALGQLHYVPGHEGDPLYAFNYPDNNNWSQQLKFAFDSEGRPLYETEPSNWSAAIFPNGSDYAAILGNGAPVNLDRATGGITLDSLTIQGGASLNLEDGTTLTARAYDFQGDGVLTEGGGGGAFPVVTILPGGTLSKSSGKQTYELQGNIVLNTKPGANILCASGILQLPGNSGLLDSPVFSPAAGATIDLVGQDPGTHAQTALVQGTLSNSNGTGTVRLSGHILGGNRDYASNDPQTPVILNFTGDVFQWTGGQLGIFQGQNPFTNVGTMNLTGPDGKALYALLTNSGNIFQSAGALDMSGGSITNAAGALYDLGEGANVTGQFATFTNLGLLRKSTGAGTTTFEPVLNNQSGTVQVSSGTLQFPNFPLASNTLDGGTWRVDDNAVLVFRPDSSITINKGDVTLRGANSSFPPIYTLTDNQGSFALLAQRSLTTYGPLSNEGTITLDAGSTLHVNGQFTASGTASLAVVVGGTQSQGAQSPGVLQTAGTVTLAGNLVVSLASGAALPGAGDLLAIVSAGGPVEGAFANVPSGARLTTADGRGSFQVNYGSGSAAGASLVTLTGFVSSGGGHTSRVLRR